MNLKHVVYSELNSKQKEIRNFQIVAGLLADYGFNCIKLSDDWQGADFLAYHKDGDDTLKVQLKSRLTIANKYFGKEIWIAFQVKNSWYLVKHDELLEMVRSSTIWLDSESWCVMGIYHSDAPNSALLEKLESCRLLPINPGTESFA